MPRPVKKTFAEKQAEKSAAASQVVTKALEAENLKEKKFLASCAALDREIAAIAALRISERLAREKAEADKLAKMTPEYRASFEYAAELYNEVGRYVYLNSM